MWSSRHLTKFNWWYLNSENGLNHLLLLNEAGTIYWKCLPFLSVRKNDVVVCVYVCVCVCVCVCECECECEWIFMDYQSAKAMLHTARITSPFIIQHSSDECCLLNMEVALTCQYTSDPTTCITSQKTAVCMVTAVTTLNLNLYLSMISTSFFLPLPHNLWK
jgi:hypothetical protein